MKKFLLMFAAVAAIAFVGCKTETKPAEETPVEEPAAVEYTEESVAADLLNCADEAAAVNFLEGIKTKAQELLDGGDQNGYFNIINILKTVWENNKEAILAKIPTLAEKMEAYITVPDNLKDGFTAFVENAAKEKLNEAGDAVKEAAEATVDAAAAKVEEGKEAVKDAVADGADAVKEAVK